MTLISTGALDRALVEVAVGDVAKLVRRMHQLVQRTLGQDGGEAESDDGLELGACFIHSKESKLTFVGARFDLFEVTGTDVVRHKGDKKGIGYSEVPQTQQFSEITVDITPSTTFYLTTDGAVDQISDVSMRGFGKKRFGQLLLDIQTQPMATQKDSIRHELARYQGEAPRLDDIAIIGFKTLPVSDDKTSRKMRVRPVTATQKIQDSLDAQGIFFCFSGYMTEDNLLSMGATLRQKLELVDADKSEARAIFAIFVEQAQNIIRYSSDILYERGEARDQLRRGFLAIGQEEGRYFVSCGNLIAQSDVKRLQEHLTKISDMDGAELEKFYKEVLRNEVPEGSKGAGVGFIDIARRAKNGFDFDFKKVDGNYAYFFLKAYI